MTKPNALTFAPTLLNTRPSHQAQALTELLLQQGFEVLNCPTLHIQPVSLPAAALQDWRQFDKVFFISQNAVTHFMQQWQILTDSKPVFYPHQIGYAIGQATYEAMRAQQWPVKTVAHGKAFVTESLLDSSELQDLSGQRCLIIKGQAGRDALANGLRTAGAKVTEWALYQRQSMPLCVDAWHLFQQVAHPVVLATSLSSIDALLQALPALTGQKKHQAWLFLKPIIVFSDRIKTQLQDLGWQGRIWVVPEQSNQGILSVMKQLQQEQSP